MANLRYQQQWLQQTEKGVLQAKSIKTALSFSSLLFQQNSVFAFDLLRLSRASEAALLSRVSRTKLSEPALLFKVGEFFVRLEDNAVSMGTPCASCRGQPA